MELTKEQKDIQDKVLSWLDSSEQSAAIAGYAGTGKTTVMGNTAERIIDTHPDIKIAFTAPTGKAALVLESKLSCTLSENTSVSTVHSLIYHKDIHAKTLRWIRNSVVDADLIVVDEASMVTAAMYRDLLSFNKKVLFIGDSGQLPPVGEDLFLPLQDTDLRLETVHRQALDSPIIRMATYVRQGRQLPYGVYGTAAKMHRTEEQARQVFNRFLARIGEEETVILCGTNRTRVQLNKSARRIRGFNSHLPEVGERLVCLRNDRDTGLRNGQLLQVCSTQGLPADPIFMLEVEGLPMQVPVAAWMLNNPNAKSGMQETPPAATEWYKKHPGAAGPMYFDYGYALSVHKAQGSEWGNVVLIDERTQYMNDSEYRRWLYTGITRAKERLLILS